MRVDFKATRIFPPQRLSTRNLLDDYQANNERRRQTTSTIYDFASGLPTSVTDPNGRTTSTSYTNQLLGTGAVDPFGRPGVVTDPQGRTTVMRYFDTARKSEVWSDLNSPSDFKLRTLTSSDQLGRAIRTETSEDGGLTYGVFSDTVYQQMGRITITTNPMRAPAAPTDGWTRATKDDLGRVVRVETFSERYPSGTSTGVVTTSYNANQTTVTDQAGKVRRSVTDALGRLVRVDEPDGTGNLGSPDAPAQPTSYTYDSLGNLTRVEQGSQPARTFIYDALSRLKQANNPESGIIGYNYDDNSNLFTKTDARGVATTFAYDGFNRVISKTHSGPAPGGTTPAVSYVYDTLGAALNGKGRLTSVSSSVSSYSYGSYDVVGRLLTGAQTTDGQTYPMSYQYNLAGAMTSESYPSGKVVATEYDAAGRMAGVTDQASGAYYAGGTAGTANAMAYTAHGAVAAARLGNGRWEHTDYNSRLQPTVIGLGTSAADSSLLRLDYSFGTTNNNGNVLSQRIVIAGSLDVTQSYTYDELNRLKTAGEVGWSQTYDYDRWGNRAVRAGSYIPSPRQTPTSNSASDLPVLFSQASNRVIAMAEYGYDAAGNLTSMPNKVSGADTMTYDAENRQASFNGTAGQYFYDGNGHRVKKIDASGTTVFVYNAGGQLVAEYTNTTSPPSGGGGTSYLTSDHLSSTRVVTKADGTVKARYDYLPFGEELVSGIGQRTVGMGYGGADATRQKFTQKERDNESGLDYFGSRYFSSSQGRFTSVDSVKLTPVRMQDPQRFNLYAYVRDNPMKFIDPEGKDVDLANDTKEGRRRALLNITVNLTTSERRNIGVRKNANGKYELYVKDPSKVDPSKASAGYKYLTNLIGNHQLNINYTLIPKGGSATSVLDGTVYTQKALSAAGDSGGVTAYLPNTKTGGYDAEIFVPEGGSPSGVKGLTKSGKDVQITNPDFLITAHELFGETFKLTPGNTHLQNNIVDDSEKVIKIENEIRQFHGLPLRSGKDHGYMREEMTVRPR